MNTSFSIKIYRAKYGQLIYVMKKLNKSKYLMICQKNKDEDMDELTGKALDNWG